MSAESIVRDNDDESVATESVDINSEQTSGFSLARIHIAADRAWTGLPDVVSGADLQSYAAELRLQQQAHDSADALLARARFSADDIVKRARQQARVLGDTQLKLWQEAYEARQEELSDALGQAVSVVVESVLKSVLGSSDDLPVRVSIELAMRVLTAELRASVLCHPLDLPLVQAATGRLGATTLAADSAIPRGQLVFSGQEGDVRVEGQRVIDRLLVDLRQVLSSKGTATQQTSLQQPLRQPTAQGLKP